MPDLRLLADEDLMPLIQGGSADAFGVLYDRHSSAAFSLSYRITGRRAEAEESLQDAFLAVWRSGARYDPRRGSVRSWLLGIVHNRTIDAVRRASVHDRRRASADGIEEQLEARELTDVEVVRRLDAVRVRAALDELPPEQVRVIELAYFGGFTHVEIAEMLEMPLGTVKARMRLGLQKLRTRLEEVAA
jgi:RNA polymerase sigma-70 factor (ECF subfamily)